MKEEEHQVLTEAIKWYNRIEKAKTSTSEDEMAHLEAIEEAEDKLLKAIELLTKIKIK